MLGFSLKYILESLQECAKIKIDVLWKHGVSGFVFSFLLWVYLQGVSAFLPCSGSLSHPWSWQDLICRMAASVKEQSTKPIPLPQPPPCEWVPSSSAPKTWAALHSRAMAFGHLLKFKDCFFSFSFFYRGDNDEEEAAKLKVEHHDLSVAGLQSPGKPRRQVCRMWHVTTKTKTLCRPNRACQQTLPWSLPWASTHCSVLRVFPRGWLL